MTMLNAAHGARLKARGMQLALDFNGPWREKVLDEFKDWIREQKARGETCITVEQFRSQATNHPTCHFAWGSFPAIAMAAGLIAPKWAAPGIQDRVKAASPRTRSHEVKRWVVL